MVLKLHRYYVDEIYYKINVVHLEKFTKGLIANLNVQSDSEE